MLVAALIGMALLATVTVMASRGPSKERLPIRIRVEDRDPRRRR